MQPVFAFGVVVASIRAVPVGTGVDALPEFSIAGDLTPFGLKTMAGMTAAHHALPAFTDIALITGTIVVAQAAPIFGSGEARFRARSGVAGVAIDHTSIWRRVAIAVASTASDKEQRAGE